MAITLYSSSPMRNLSDMSNRYTQHIIVLIFILASHIGVFHLLQKGLLFRAPEIIKPQPKEVTVSLIALSPPTTSTPKPEHASPKTVPITVPIVKRIAPPRPTLTTHPTPIALTPRPLAPAINPLPSQNAINVPRSAPPSEPAVPAIRNTASEVAIASASVGKAHEAPAQPKMVSGVEYIRKPEKVYPPISQQLGEEGKTILRVLVNEKGHPEDVSIQKSSGYDRLDQASKKAAKGALFKPYTEEGKALSVYVLIPISYTLEQEE